MIRSRKDFIPCAPIDAHFAGHSVSARFEQSNGDVYEGAFDKGAAHGQGCAVCGFVIFDVWEKMLYCFARPAGYLHFGFKMLCFHGVFFVFFDMFILLKAII